MVTHIVIAEEFGPDEIHRRAYGCDSLLEARLVRDSLDSQYCYVIPLSRATKCALGYESYCHAD